MATVTVSIGSNSSIDTETPSGCTGSGPWVVTFGTNPTGVSVGDICLIVDAGASGATFTYLLTAISGSNYTLRYITDSGGNGSASPCSLADMSFAQASALFKRAYSTMTLWGADLDNTGYYSSGDHAVGECHADSVFSESPSINTGDTVGLDSRTLTAHVDSRHDGTKGSGVVLQAVTPGSGSVFLALRQTALVTVSWLEFDGEDDIATGCLNISGMSSAFVQNCLFYDFTNTSVNQTYILSTVACCPTYTNNFFWNIKNTHADGSINIFKGYSDDRGIECYNNTIYGVDAESATSYIFLDLWAHDETKVRNLVLMDWNSGGGLSNVSPHASVVLDYWGMEATDSDVTNEVIDTVANTFADSTIGDPDLHLKDGCKFIDAGVDLGTSPTNVNIDIDGRDRHSNDDIWDIGADESPYSAPSTGKKIKPNTRFNLFHGVEGLDSFTTAYNF